MGPADRPRLVAGTSAGERRPAIRRGPEPDWYLPAHARDPNGVRSRQSAQVAAGADVILAQTYLTHRRALARVGAARRARELTAAAVALARSAVDEGLEGRAAQDQAEAGQVLVAGVLPPVDDEPETATGRLLAHDAAIERDLATHAGMLAESGVDLIVVEGGSMAQAVAGAAAVRSVGLPAWVAIEADQERSQEELDPFEPAACLIAGQPAADDLAAFAGRGMAFGVWLMTAPDPELLARLAEAWLGQGATAIALADDATPERLASVAAAIEAFADANRLARAEAGQGWHQWLSMGSELAPTGAAIWLSDAEPAEAAPDGWAWDVAPPDDARRLPADHYRLAVASGPGIGPDLAAVCRALGPGGVLVAATQLVSRLPESLRVLHQREEGGLRWIICRREDR